MASIRSNSSNDIEMEPLYLVCSGEDGCGEAFSTMDAAADHVHGEGTSDHLTYIILPESEAM